MANNAASNAKSPPQQSQPGHENKMAPPAISIRDDYRGANKLKNKTAIITGGDSGIGRAVALHFAREGANVAIVYLSEHSDAAATVALIEAEGGRALRIAGDCGNKQFCFDAVDQTIKEFGQLDILVNNAGEQHVQHDIEKIDEAQLRQTFETNIFGYFFMAQAALRYLPKNGVIINTGSVTSFKGSPRLIDYSATKGAIQAFTFSLAQALAEKKIRVNEVAPGPIWTPLIPSTFSPKEVQEFGKNTLMKRAGQPAEVAPAYVFLASDDASYMTGQIMHINGGGFIGV